MYIIRAHCMTFFIYKFLCCYVCHTEQSMCLFTQSLSIYLHVRHVLCTEDTKVSDIKSRLL